ncbi:hypothetical protein Pmar_PMAR020609 [Perkinsus marinus ATCC 50983]|uniref:Uncharacterized protein n=1 Tax=Perkinsus marinus (strain ATCC 50983 / TXsc) TaxID=423536 RepID=C5L7I5_PERM5|nr:hypothetical protein Pmar_PMAR021835 [Perkinsus marinus ATCC 50983]XP_002775631.1 hypothetical protein Pmar_PMAR020609 [Perkinsus marinus ATCC 50983]EER04328.1 hypothetical protein Pmar_PMAR021835 [Perkinsus marinus ATCC 50983]EER07447.1 hypothetical protein Pmar_PMAR020609 [Perkinsus marinus ATCC 50983]|eukprot:XP_002772512.1 hypothetical protein Pmar_PMAR021835 [Perkinsus marinus ATCC 50983]
MTITTSQHLVTDISGSVHDAMDFEPTRKHIDRKMGDEQQNHRSEVHDKADEHYARMARKKWNASENYNK